ncbi:MAG: hypothetical protein Kow0063_18010 [Anaerolineae bacterium]
MAKDVQDPGRRHLFEEILKDISGFFREMNRELRAPSARERELAAIQERLGELEAAVQETQAQEQIDHQALLEAMSQMAERLAALERSLTPQEIPLWKETLQRLKGLALLLAGATGGALYEALVQDEVYPEFKERLEQIGERVNEILAPAPAPEPEPAGRTVPATGLEPELVFIPGGRFLMGSDRKRDPLAFEDELPQHEVYVGDFYIARYPVTNAGYKRFLDATGYQMPDWFWQNGYPHHRADHPVVFVSWYDARAYCRWLSKATGRPYRLPGEAEWEKAARGRDGRIYPWGNTFDSRRCNSWESWKDSGQADTTTPVGRYPSGASPYGVMDMAGNVWEWCHSRYAPYPYNAKDGREGPESNDTRVLRGGSFYNPGGNVRCASRVRDSPDYRHDDLGFRVVVAPGF